MRKTAFLLLLSAMLGCHPKSSVIASQDVDSIAGVGGNQDTGRLTEDTGPGDEELAALAEREQQLAYKTEDPSYSEQELTSTQYILDEENDLAFRSAVGRISNISCTVYLAGIQIPKDNAAKPDSLNKIVTKMGKKHLMVLVNDRQLSINNGLIPDEIQERMDPTKIGAFVYNNTPYLLLKFYTFSFINSGSGNVNLLINVSTGKVWAIETPGEVLFKSLIDAIDAK